MGGSATLAGVSVDWMAGPITTPMVATIGVIPLLHSIFDVIPAEATPLGAGAQQRKARTTANRPATNHTSQEHSTLFFVHVDRGGSDLPAEASQLLAAVINRAIATHRSASKPIRDTAHTLTRECC
jgi:hypothetical protein